MRPTRPPTFNQSLKLWEGCKKINAYLDGFKKDHPRNISIGDKFFNLLYDHIDTYKKEAEFKEVIWYEYEQQKTKEMRKFFVTK